MKENTFYKDKTFEYPEIAILMDTVNKNNPVGRFIIPILTPNLKTDRLIKSEKGVVDTSNIINLQTNRTMSLTEQNYVTLSVPEYMFGSGIEYKKGDKFIIVFIGGNVNKIQIIGVC